MRRARTTSSPTRQTLVPLLVAFCGVLGYAAVDGGYFPRWWGLGTIAFASAAAASLLTSSEVAFPRRALLLVGAVAGLAAFVALSAAWATSLPLAMREVERAVLYLAAAAAAVVVARERPRALLAGTLAALVATASWNLAYRVTRIGDDVDLGNRGILAEPVGYENALGAMCAIGLVLAAALPLERRARVVAGVPLALALVLSENRAALLALAVGVLVLVALRRPSRRLVAAFSALVVVLLLLGFASAGAERRAYWSAALEQGASAPAAGEGAGSFGRHWLDARAIAADALDAHGLYVETFAELGVGGLAVLSLVLVPPLLLGRRDPAAAAAVAVFAVHAAFDWDWEMPAVTLPALFCLAALALRDDRVVRTAPGVRTVAAGAAIVLAALALVPFVGHVQEEAAESALRDGRAAAALDHAARAEALLPWSPEPHLTAALVHQQRGFLPEARVELQEAIEHDGTDARLWRVLATVTEGAQRREALERVEQLDPLGAPPRY